MKMSDTVRTGRQIMIRKVRCYSQGLGTIAASVLLTACASGPLFSDSSESADEAAAMTSKQEIQVVKELEASKLAETATETTAETIAETQSVVSEVSEVQAKPVEEPTVVNEAKVAVVTAPIATSPPAASNAANVELQSSDTKTKQTVEIKHENAVENAGEGVVENLAKEPAVPVQQKAPVSEQEVTSAESADQLVASLKSQQAEVEKEDRSAKLNRAALPIVHGIWKLKQQESESGQELVISTPTWGMGTAGYNSQIWLTLREDRLVVHSSSDIDVMAGNSGIRIDGGELIEFTDIESNNNAVVVGEWLDALAKGIQMEIVMGFFPDRKPRSEQFKSSVRLDGVSRVVRDYRALSK